MKNRQAKTGILNKESTGKRSKLRGYFLVSTLSIIVFLSGFTQIEDHIVDLKNPYHWKRVSAAEALGKTGDPRAVEPLISVLEDENFYVRRATVKALGKIGDPRAVESLIAALKDEDSYVRELAADALGTITDARAVEPLIGALKDENLYIRRSAVKALGEIGDPRATEPLITVLRDEDSDVRELACKVLVRIGQHAIEQLITALKDNDYNVRHSAVTVLARIGQPAVEPLIAALKDENHHVRGSAAKALGEIGDPCSFEPLIAALEDKDSYVRESTTEALGKIGDSKAITPLISALSDEAWGVRYTACEALQRIGPNAVEPLLQHLRDEPASAEWARFALALCGHAESADIVLQKLSQGSYRAEIRCLMMGWFGVKEILEQVPLGSELRQSAMKQQLDEAEWNQVVKKTADDSSRLEFTLSAISIVPRDEKLQTDVEELCLRYIRRGDIRIIPQLIQLINMYATIRLAEDYINCGQSDLKEAAVRWVRARGYYIGRGDGSHRAIWGSDNK